MTGEVNSELLTSMKQDIERSLSEFGRHSFWDKGPREVCDIPYRRLRALSPQDAAATLLALSEISEESKRYTEEAVHGLFRWRELFDESAPWYDFIAEMYG